MQDAYRVEKLAHFASLMTGAGFQNALLDVAALSACLGSANAASVPAGLIRHEQERLSPPRQLVSGHDKVASRVSGSD